MTDYVLSAFSDEAGKTLEEQIAALKRNNIHYMEIRAVNGLNICKTPLETVAEYKKELDKAGIHVLTIGSCIGKVKLTDDYTQHLAMFLHTLGVAKILQAKRIRMFSIKMPENENPDNYTDLVMQRMDEMLKIADSCGIELYHENEKGIYGDTETRVLKLMDNFAGRMKFIFDPANFIQCDCDPKNIYPLLKDRISYFHMKDALKETKGVVPVGEGDGHIYEILKDYSANHKNTMLTVEPHLKSFAGLKDPTSIRSERETVYKDNTESFDAAVKALKDILKKGELSYE